MKYRFAFMIALIGLASLFSSVTAQTGSSAPFRTLAAQAGIDVGAAVAIDPLISDPQYSSTLAREFNIITPENALKFSALSTAPGKYNFTNADYIVNFAQANNLKVFGHVLVWHNRIPQWVLTGGYNRDQLIEIMRNHITTVVSRYRGKIQYWDVVNEAVYTTGGYRSSLWYDLIGPEFIEIAFRAAHAADPNALLFYNDYSNEGISVKSDFIYNMVRDLKARGVPIHGVGFQMHLRLDMPPNMDKVRQNIDRLAALGLKVRITEIDVKMNVLTTPLEDRLQQQASLFAAALKTCLDSQNCTGYTSWGFTDRYTWLAPETPLMFDASYQPKPAYFSIQNAFVNFIQSRIVPTPTPRPLPTLAPTLIPTLIPTAIPPPTLVPTLIPTFTATPIPEPTTPTVVIDVAGIPAAGQPVDVVFRLYKVENLYGLEARCQANPGLMVGTGYTQGDMFTSNNSFIVDSGFNAADGTWNIAASRLRPSPAISGGGTAFTLRFTLAQAAVPAINCTVLAVNPDGFVLPLPVVTTLR